MCVFNRNTVRDITIKALCYLPDNVADEIEITGIIMSYFLPAEVEDMELLQNILNSSLAGRHSLLIHLKKREYFVEVICANINEKLSFLELMKIFCFVSDWQPCLNQKIASADDMASLFVKLIDALTSYIIKGNMPPDKFVIMHLLLSC